MTERIREKDKKATTLVFFRHGKTAFPDDRFYSRTDDPPLDGEGKAQAERLGRWVKKGAFSVLYGSPLRRTMETAEAISAGTGLSVIRNPGLQERTMGEWDGLTPIEARERHPEAFRRWKEDPIHFAPPGGESWIDFSARVDRTVREMIASHPEERVAVATHVGPIRVLVSRALEIPDENNRRIVLGYGSATRIDYTSQGGNLTYLGVIPFDQEPC